MLKFLENAAHRTGWALMGLPVGYSEVIPSLIRYGPYRWGAYLANVDWQPTLIPVVLLDGGVAMAKEEDCTFVEYGPGDVPPSRMVLTKDVGEWLNADVGPALHLDCCQLECDKPAEFVIHAMRLDTGEGTLAGPDLHGDITEACPDHVGMLLGHQPGCHAPDEIYWSVYQLPVLSKEPWMWDDYVAKES